MRKYKLMLPKIKLYWASCAFRIFLFSVQLWSKSTSAMNPSSKNALDTYKKIKHFHYDDIYGSQPLRWPTGYSHLVSSLPQGTRWLYATTEKGRSDEASRPRWSRKTTASTSSTSLPLGKPAAALGGYSGNLWRNPPGCRTEASNTDDASEPPKEAARAGSANRGPEGALSQQHSVSLLPDSDSQKLGHNKCLLSQAAEFWSSLLHSNRQVLFLKRVLWKRIT